MRRILFWCLHRAALLCTHCTLCIFLFHLLSLREPLLTTPDPQLKFFPTRSYPLCSLEYSPQPPARGSYQRPQPAPLMGESSPLNTLSIPAGTALALIAVLLARVQYPLESSGNNLEALPPFSFPHRELFPRLRSHPPRGELSQGNPSHSASLFLFLFRLQISFARPMNRPGYWLKEREIDSPIIHGHPALPPCQIPPCKRFPRRCRNFPLFPLFFHRSGNSHPSFSSPRA